MNVKTTFYLDFVKKKTLVYWSITKSKKSPIILKEYNIL